MTSTTDADLFEGGQEAKRLRDHGMIDGEDDVDEIICLTVDLGMALVKVQALIAMAKSMLADIDGAQSMCAGSKGRIEEFDSCCADFYKKRMNKVWDGKEYCNIAEAVSGSL